MFILLFCLIQTIYQTATNIQLARVQWCGCNVALVESLCVQLDDCRWQNYTCVNITGVAQTVSNNSTTTNTTTNSSDTNSNSTNTTSTEYDFTDPNFDWDSVIVTYQNFDIPDLPDEGSTTNSTDDTSGTDSSTNSTDSSSNSTDTTTNSTDTSSNSTDTSSNSTDTSSNSTDTSSNSTDTSSNSTDTSSNSTDTSSNSTDTSSNSTDTSSNSTDTSSNSTNTTTVTQTVSITYYKSYVNKTFSDKVTCSSFSDQTNCISKRWPNQIFCIWKDSKCISGSCSDLDLADCENTFFCINYGFCSSCLPQNSYANQIYIWLLALIIIVY